MTFLHGYDDGTALLRSGEAFTWPEAPKNSDRTVDLSRPRSQEGLGLVAAGVLLDANTDVGIIAAVNHRLNLLIASGCTLGERLWRGFLPRSEPTENWRGESSRGRDGPGIRNQSAASVEAREFYCWRTFVRSPDHRLCSGAWPQDRSLCGLASNGVAAIYALWRRLRSRASQS